MIVSFSIENFRSFSAEETFSLVASKRLAGAHEEHTVPIPESDEHVLRAGVLYGANGAGKSNLFKALRYVRSVVLEPREKNSGTGRERFRFAGNTNDPSCFDLLFILHDRLYRFGFKANDERITEEWLVQVSGNREKAVYERATDEAGRVTVNFQGSNNPGEKLKALATVGGPQNQSFLATAYATLDEADRGELGEVLAWFQGNLKLVGPRDSFQGLGTALEEFSAFTRFAGDFLKAVSTGVDELNVKKDKTTLDDLNKSLGENAVSNLLRSLNKGQGIAVASKDDEEEFLIERTDEDHFHRVTIQAIHEHAPGQKIPLDLSEESDGTRRLLNLLPALHHLQLDEAIYFIDEIDRSLHPMLVWEFLQFFLRSCAHGRSQIILTTHESHLLDLELLRRDEIWFAEKDSSGATRLYSLSDFKVRQDLAIRKHYLQGRFGAVPFFADLDRLMPEPGKTE